MSRSGAGRPRARRARNTGIRPFLHESGPAEGGRKIPSRASDVWVRFPTPGTMFAEVYGGPDEGDAAPAMLTVIETVIGFPSLGLPHPGSPSPATRGCVRGTLCPRRKKCPCREAAGALTEPGQCVQQVQPWQYWRVRFGFLAAAVFVHAALVSGQEIPGPGTTLPPQVIRTVRAVYTADGRAAGIEGTVRVDATVLTNGTVADDAKVVQSLDTEFGLDDEAVKASRQWKFKPATRDGQPVTAHVVIEHTFTLRSK
jgi:TonB family protein